jgi:uncharacterized repeat protein (TIGR01451 family)
MRSTRSRLIVLVQLGFGAVLACLAPVVAQAASADLAVSVTAPGSAPVGSTITFAVTITNNGPNSAQSVVLTANIPSGTTYVGAADTGATHFAGGSAPPVGSSTGTITANLTSLATGAAAAAAVSLSFEVAPATPVGTLISLTATVSATTPDPSTANNTRTGSIAASAAAGGTADLAVTMSGPSITTPGGNITYAITLTNNGPDDAQSVLLSSTLPSEVTFGGYEITGGPTPTGGTSPPNGGTGDVTASFATLADGDSFSLSITVQPLANTPSGTVISYTVSASSTTSDPSPANNAATVSTTFTVPVPLAIVTTSPLPTGKVGVVYSVQFAATGGTGGYTWNIPHGAASSLSLSPGGLLSGTPNASGDFGFGVSVTDSNNDSVEGQFSVHIDPADSYSYIVWIPVASHANGLSNSRWRTDLGLLNTGATTANVQLKFFGTTGVVTGTTSVAPGAQSILADVVGQLPASNSGALEVLSDQPLRVTSRTYNQVASAAACYPNGTQGQGYPAVLASDGLVAGAAAYLPGLTENTAYRCNIGLLNAGTTAATVLVELFDGAGAKLTQYTVTLTVGGWAQVTQPFKTKAGQTAMDRGYAKFTVQTGSGVFGFASVLDNITNDPTTVYPQR